MAAVLAGCRSPRSAVKPARDDAVQQLPLRTDRAATKLAEAHAHYATGFIHEMNGEQEAALQEYYQAALGDPENEPLILDLSRRFLQNKQPAKALELLAVAASQPKATGLIFARLGLVYAQLGKNDQAIAADRAAIKRSPTALPGYQNLFVTYLQAKQDPEALKVLDEAARQSGVDVEFLLGLSELYANFALQTPAQKEKIKPKALAVLNRAEKLNATSPTLRLKLADGFSSLGESEKAAQLYLEALKKLPDVPLLRRGIHAKLADIYRRSSDPKRAKAQLEAVVRDDPTNPQAYYWLGRIALEDKNPDDAAVQFSKAVLLNADLEPAYYDLAVAQIEIRKPGEALATLEKARKKFAPSFLLEFLTAMAFGGQKGYTEALQHYTAAEVLAKANDPKSLNHDFYYQFGAAAERKGDYDQAEKYFEKSLQLKPDFAEAQNYLGYMWAEHGRKLEQARELIEKAVQAEPKNAAYLDSLAWVLFKLHQPQEALSHILKAIELSEKPDPTLLDHLGDIYAALKQPDKAHEAWTKSLGLEPNEEIRKKLEAAGH
jgi:tetratricopeptide (TPR) repeat protein